MDENVNNRLIIMGVLVGALADGGTMTEWDARQILRSVGYNIETPDYREDLAAVLTGLQTQGLVSNGQDLCLTDDGRRFAAQLQGVVNPFGR